MFATIKIIVKVNTLCIIARTVVFLQFPDRVKIRHLQVSRWWTANVMGWKGTLFIGIGYFDFISALSKTMATWTAVLANFGDAGGTWLKNISVYEVNVKGIMRLLKVYTGYLRKQWNEVVRRRLWSLQAPDAVTFKSKARGRKRE